MNAPRRLLLACALTASAALAGAAHSAPSSGASRHISAAGYSLELHIAPNEAPRAIAVALLIRRHGKPVRAARVRLTLTMLDMPMAGVVRELRQIAPGTYTGAGLAFGMPGRWGLRFAVRPRDARRFVASIVDRVGP